MGIISQHGKSFWDYARPYWVDSFIKSPIPYDEKPEQCGRKKKKTTTKEEPEAEPERRRKSRGPPVGGIVEPTPTKVATNVAPTTAAVIKDSAQQSSATRV